MSEQGSAPGAKPVILLVDDDADCRHLVRDAICQWAPDVEIYEAASGEEALRFLQREGPFTQAPRPSLIYLDLEMPGLSGIETARLIRSHDHFRDMVLVMMTGVTDDRQKALAMRSGLNSYTHKPADPKCFFESVQTSAEYWLKIHQYPRQRPGTCAA